MKYVLIIPDGCADEPQSLLNGLTPLQAANTPAMDELAAKGKVGRANHTPECFAAGSDVATLSLLGFDPKLAYTGRAPLEAAAQGLKVQDDDWVVRCNLVTIDGQRMVDFTAGHVSSEDARSLLAAAQNFVAHRQGIRFIPGVSYRNLMHLAGSEFSHALSSDTKTTPPHDLTDQLVVEDYPRGPGSRMLCDLMDESYRWFVDHPINAKRRQAGQLPITHIWLWGLGRKPKLASFFQRHGVRGAMITAVDLLRGIANLIGWENIVVPGATGYVDTDYSAKAQFAIETLQRVDLVCIHIEAPDEASHEGSLEKKIRAIEAIDREIVGPVLDYLRKQPEWRILVTPDHPTYLSTKTHVHGDVPFVVAGTGISPGKATSFNERSAADSEISYPEGFRLVNDFLTHPFGR